MTGPLGALHLYKCHLGNFIARTAIHACHLPMAKLMGENWAAFCPSCKGQMPTESTREKRTAFCPSPIQNSNPKTTAAWACIVEPISQAIPQFLGHYGSFTCSALSPSLGSVWDQRGMGQQMLSFLPLPWIPSGSTGFGASGSWFRVRFSDLLDRSGGAETILWHIISRVCHGTSSSAPKS